LSKISGRRRFFIGLVAGVIATLAYYVGTELLGLPYPPEAIFQLLVFPVPGSIQSVVVENLLEYAKYGAFTFASFIFAVLYGAIGVVLGRLSDWNLPTWQLNAVGTAIGTFLGLGFEAVLAPSVSILSSALGWGIVAALAILINLGYSSIVISKINIKTPEAQMVAGGFSPARRKLLKRVVIGGFALGVIYLASRLGLSLFSGQPVVTSNTPIPINGPPATVNLAGVPQIFSDQRIADLVGSEVTDNRSFYRVDINAVLPQLNFDQWMLKVTGKVEKELTISKNDLLGMPASDEYCTLECVSNTINPPSALISNAKWTGVPLSMILKQAGLAADAKYVIFHCADGYSVGVPLDRALEPGAMLAYKMNDVLLPTEHGAPLRALVPGIYGMMNAKWITGIEVSNSVYSGYWQDRGWSNDARIKTTSIIYYPSQGTQVHGQLPIAGVAFAGERGINKVEVSTDGGATWNEATLKPPKSSYSWVLWAYNWTPASTGSKTILARATDGNGQPQDATITNPFPNGATGYNSIEVTVT
jgi:DMSO/TMAO reductase YedYZ molybdopterin-dependent catalytic subunit